LIKVLWVSANKHLRVKLLWKLTFMLSLLADDVSKKIATYFFSVITG